MSAAEESTNKTDIKQQLITERAQQHCELAKSYSAKSQYNDAVLCLNKAINLCADNVEFYVNRAECFIHLCDYQSAILNYKKACLLAPDIYTGRLAFVFCLQAQCLADEKLYIEALENYSRASELDPAVDGYYLGSIVCLSTLGFHADCLSLVSQRIHARQQEQQQKQSSDEQAVNTSSHCDVYLADLLTLRARLHIVLSHTSDCYSDVMSALSVDPTHSEALLLKTSLDATANQLKDEAVHLSLLGRHKDALNKLTVALATNGTLVNYTYSEVLHIDGSEISMLRLMTFWLP
jgi:tetratricopeptide (TPR) repeat protein